MHLWLDDERNPADPKIQMTFGASGDEIWVKTASCAIDYLKTGSVVFISLDHDLGSGAGTGMEVAKWIEEQAFRKSLPKLNWAIHSRNTVGAKNIYRAMTNADKYWNESI